MRAVESALFLVLFLLFVQSTAYAETYYADLSFNVGSDGITDLSGLTNHPDLESKTTSDLTSKKGSVWTFNLSLPAQDVFSDFVYEVILPSGASVNYVKSSSHFRLTSRGDQIVVYGLGENKSLSILVQYQIGEVITEETGTPIEYYLGLVLLILFVAIVFFFYLLRKKDVSGGKKTEFESSSREESDESVLSDRQKDILKVLRDAGAPINQTVICDKLNLAKSSMSRNIDSLEEMGFVSKTRNGMSTMISLRKK